MSLKPMTFSFVCLVALGASLTTGCDDSTGTGGAGGATSSSTGSSSSTGKSTSSGSTSTASSSGSGSTTSGSGSTSSASSSSASSSSTGGGSMLNACDPATAEDHTNEAKVTIKFGGGLGFVYAPPCIKVSAGTSVTFEGEFAFHPLRGGEVVGITLMPDANSPITATDTGTTATFALPNAGSFGFYCNFHGPSGMKGAVFVQ